MADAKKDKLQIRNSTVDFLVFTKDAHEDGIEVREMCIRDSINTGGARCFKMRRSSKKKTIFLNWGISWKRLFFRECVIK